MERKRNPGCTQPGLRCDPSRLRPQLGQMADEFEMLLDVVLTRPPRHLQLASAGGDALEVNGGPPGRAPGPINDCAREAFKSRPLQRCMLCGGGRLFRDLGMLE